jgi:superfamily II RNA helicase
MAWQIPLLTLPQSRFVLMSATLGDTTAIREDLELRTGQKVVEIRGVHRPVPLDFVYSKQPVHEALERLVRQGNAPVYAVHFTQAEATEQAQALMSTDWCSKEEKKTLAEALKGFRFHSPFGRTVQRFLLHGVGIHHAGLLPRYRLLVEKLAQQGLLKVICGTDTLGVGINVPIRTVLFTQLCKFDGEKTDILKVRDFKQIAGRAGRAGFDSRGYVVAQAPAHVIENLRLEAKHADDPKKLRKIVKAQPPAKGYKHWDETTFQQLTERPPEPLESRFAVDHGRLLSLLQHAEATQGDATSGYQAMLDLVDQSHATAREKVELKAQAERLLEGLRRAHVVGKDGERLLLDPTLQKDFSLYHSLSLFLIEGLSTLDRQSESYALDTLTWVEAILEHPRPVLLAQQNRAKLEKINELKAAGVPFEERQAAIEDITWPRPLTDLIYPCFNGYVEAHPWLSAEAIRPKSVAREMAELQLSFSDYVKDLRLERAEGVLLRYLSEVYKALVQNVPTEHKDDRLVEISAWLRALLAVVDSSLLNEWETLLAGQDAPGSSTTPLDISADRRSFYARLRAELFALVRALARQDWEEAAATLRPGERTWAPEELAQSMEPFFAEFSGLAADHRARLAGNTEIEAEGGHLWRVRQRLLPVAQQEEEEEDDQGELSAWVIEGRVDLRGNTNPEGPLVELIYIGE